MDALFDQDMQGDDLDSWLAESNLYKRTIRQSVTFKAHDEKNECKTGDKVRIVETRPLSATKRWRLLEVVAVP